MKEMSNKSKWFTIIVILVVIALLSTGCAKETVAPTVEEPVAVETEAEPAEPVVTEEAAPVEEGEKSQIVVVIAEDPPSFNATVNAAGLDRKSTRLNASHGY